VILSGISFRWSREALKLASQVDQRSSANGFASGAANYGFQMERRRPTMWIYEQTQTPHFFSHPTHNILLDRTIYTLTTTKAYTIYNDPTWLTTSLYQVNVYKGHLIDLVFHAGFATGVHDSQTRKIGVLTA
jgi:hypothetical protein